MRKSLFLFAVILLVFVACEPQNGCEKVNYENQDIYGTWAYDFTLNDNPATKVLFINDRNVEFVSQDTLKIYHGYWDFTEVSDLGYVKYKYQVLKNEKLILTTYDIFDEKSVTYEYYWRPDLSYIEEKTLSKSFKSNLKGFLGKWEWVSTQNLDSCYEKLRNHVVDTLENTIIEFRINNSVLFYDDIDIEQNIYVNTMSPYLVSITKKDGGVVEDKILPIFSEMKSRHVSFYFPRYNNGNYTGFLNHFGGVEYMYSKGSDKLILYYEGCDLLLTYKKVE